MRKLLILFALACFSVASVFTFLSTSATVGSSSNYEVLPIPMKDYQPHIDRKRDFPKVSRSTARPTIKPSLPAKPKVVKAKPVIKKVIKKPTVKKTPRLKKIIISGIAKCIAHFESSGNPKAENPYSTASGLFQFVDGTWNNFMGYRRAKDAPINVQLRKFYIVWDGGRGASNWVTAPKCGY